MSICMVITRQYRNHAVVPMAVVTLPTEVTSNSDWMHKLNTKADQIISEFRAQFPEFRDAFFEKHMVEQYTGE